MLAVYLSVISKCVRRLEASGFLNDSDVGSEVIADVFAHLAKIRLLMSAFA